MVVVEVVVEVVVVVIKANEVNGVAPTLLLAPTPLLPIKESSASTCLDDEVQQGLRMEYYPHHQVLR